MSGLGWPRFLVLNLIAALLWATSFAGSGYLFGKASAAMLGDMATNVGIGLLVVFLVVGWVLIRLQRRQKSKERANDADDTPPPDGTAPKPDRQRETVSGLDAPGDTSVQPRRATSRIPPPR